MSYNFYKTGMDPTDVLKLSARILYSNKVDQESRISESKVFLTSTGGKFSLIDFKDVKQLCSIKTRLDPTIWDDLIIYRNAQGLEYRRVYYTIVMEVSGGNPVWRCLYNEEEKGGVKVKYEAGNTQRE